MTEVQQFQFGPTAVRVIDREGEPWFVAKDVCDVLEVDNTSQALSRLDEEEKNTIILNEGIGNPQKAIINESGLYSLVLSSRKPEAKAFKKWVTSEVLPSIRKHGGYLTPAKTQELIDNPDLIIQMAQRIKDERTRRMEAEFEAERQAELIARQNKLLDQQKSKVDFVDQVFDDGSLVDIGQAAKILDLGFGRNTLFEKLREKGVLFKNRNEPLQRYIDQSLFVLKENEIQRSAGPQIVTKVLVTQKGLYFIRNLFESQQKLGFVNTAKLT